MVKQEYIIEAEGISKAFFGVPALKNVNFRLRRGEVHALVGENGAGKSTLSKVITGVIRQDSGVLLMEGKEITLNNTKQAQDLGISIIHQEFNLVPALSIAENIFLGKERMRGIFIAEDESVAISKDLMKKVGLNISPKTLVKNLSVAEQQLIEIVKCLSYNSKVIIMDEPTAPLTKTEIQRLYQIINSLKDKGVSIIYVSHKLDEVFYLADSITVLRDGEKVGTYEKEELDEKKLVSLMVGRDLSNMYTKIPGARSNKDVVLKIKKLNKKPLLKDISFELRKGEILGVAGLMGSGRTELLRCLFGADKIDDGEIEVFGKTIKGITINKMKKMGIGFITEDRKQDGILPNLSVKENVTLGILKKLSRIGLISVTKERNAVSEMISKLNVKCASPSIKISHLSGGNQQKSLLAKWLADSVKILLLDEPTRGIDVGAKAEIYSLMSQLCENGVSIIMVSSELPEILGMSDRVLVMSEGRITGEFMREEANENNIMQAATLRNQSN